MGALQKTPPQKHHHYNSFSEVLGMAPVGSYYTLKILNSSCSTTVLIFEEQYICSHRPPTTNTVTRVSDLGPD